LKAPYISGGTALDVAQARAEERRLWRILIAMVVIIVASGFVIGTLVALLGPAGQ
jgi:type IV secretory pathway component VirB8